MCSLPLSPAFSMVIKLASIAPDGSPWDKALKKLGAEWSRISQGQVTIKIYAGGVVGDEPDMIRKMRIDQIQASIFTGVGMSYITSEIYALNLPYLVNNDDELDYLIMKMKPQFNNLMEKKGFKCIGWAKAGWVNFFSKNPVFVPADLKKQKFAVGTGEPEMLQAFRALGYNAIPISTQDIMTGLQSGMIDAFYSTPLVTAAFQWFGIAKNMTSLRIAPMIGGIVLNKKTWNQVPEKYRGQMIQACEKILKDLYVETTKLDDKALETMKQHGLQVNTITPEMVPLWKQDVENGYEVFIGKTFPRKLFDELRGHLKEYRSKK